MPLVVLAHGIPLAVPFPGLPSDTMEAIVLALQVNLVRLVPNAKHVKATVSGHNIQQDQPDSMIAAIRQVVAAVREPGTWATPAAGMPTTSAVSATRRTPIGRNAEAVDRRLRWA